MSNEKNEGTRIPKSRESGSNANVHFQPKNAVSEIYLDPHNPIAREYNDRDIYEITVRPDYSTNLTQMVMTGTVGSLTVHHNGKYQYPELGDDDEAHDHPDYEKLHNSDPVVKENYVEEFINNPNNYEKVEKVEKTENKEATEGNPSSGEA